MYPFKYHLRRHIILGEWERIARVAPKAASNRYPYLFSYDTVELERCCIKYRYATYHFWNRGVA